jgi:hypothetical protein
MSEAQTMEQRHDQFAEGLFEKITGTMEVATVYLGDVEREETRRVDSEC